MQKNTALTLFVTCGLAFAFPVLAQPPSKLPTAKPNVEGMRPHTVRPDQLPRRGGPNVAIGGNKTTAPPPGKVFDGSSLMQPPDAQGMKPMNGTTHKDAMKMLQGMKLPEGLKAPGGTPPQDTMKTPQRMKHPGDAKTLGGTKSGQPRRGE